MAAKAVDVATGPLGEADPKLIRRMRREIDIMSRLDHPNIVRYLGHGARETSSTSPHVYGATPFFVGNAVPGPLQSFREQHSTC